MEKEVLGLAFSKPASQGEEMRALAMVDFLPLQILKVTLV